MSLSLRFLIRVMGFGSIWLTAGVVLACGGFFAPEPMDQTSQRMIFTINDDGTITTIQGIGYEGEADDFVWMLPVPSMPTVDVAELETLDALDRATAPQIIPPANPCAGLTWTEYGGEGVGAGGPPQEGSAGPYDYVVLDEDSADDIVTWLHDAGYNVPDAILPALEKYVDMDMLFLAMKLRPTAAVGDIQPVKLTYKAANPTISIQFAATSVTQPSMPFRVWIFGDTRYMAENYANPPVDFWNFRAESSSIETPYPFSGVSSQYFLARQNIQQEYDGKAFITEYAMPAEALTGNLGSEDPTLLELLSKYKYVTRMEALMSADQMTGDVTFVPFTGAPDVSRTIDLDAFVDPLHYWGCSTRDLLDDNNNPDDLLEEFSLINGAHIGYPAGWMQSEVLLNLVTVAHVLSPEAVTADTIRAFLNGEATPPMFIIFGTVGDTWGEGELRAALGFDRFAALPDTQVWESAERYELFQAVEKGFELHFELLTTKADYDANSVLYRAMLDYAANHAYFAHPDLRHTLFMAGGTGENDPDAWIVGFPTGWREHSTDEGLVAIYPDTLTETSAAVPFILVYHIIAPGETWRERIQYLLEAYGIHDTSTLLSVPESNCPVPTFSAPFERNGRQGFLQFGARYYVETSAPAALFPEYGTVLKQSAESFKEAFNLCG